MYREDIGYDYIKYSNGTGKLLAKVNPTVATLSSGVIPTLEYRFSFTKVAKLNTTMHIAVLLTCILSHKIII